MTTASESATRTRKREQTRQKLLDSGLTVFSRAGYERATVDEIVREAGFSKGAFYVHFESKEDLFWAMLEERITNAQEAFRQALSPGACIRDNLRSVLSRLFALSTDDPKWSAMFLEFVAHAGRNEKVRARLQSMYLSWRTLIVEVLTAGQAASAIRKDIDIDFIASALIALVEGSMTQARIAGTDVNLDEVVDPLSGLVAQWLEG
jgi:AcrR family transcriptional regulator